MTIVKGDMIEFDTKTKDGVVCAEVIRVNAKTYTASTKTLSNGAVASYRVPKKKAKPREGRSCRGDLSVWGGMEQ